MKRWVCLAACATLLASSAATLGQSASGAEHSTLRDAVSGRLKPAQIKAVGVNNRKTVVKRLPWVSSGTLAAAQDSLVLGAADERLEAADAPPLVQLHPSSPTAHTL